MTEEISFTTSNFYLAAALLAKGAVLSGADHTDSRHVRFTFEVGTLSETFSALESAWNNKSLILNGRAFADAIREVRLMIYSGGDPHVV